VEETDEAVSEGVEQIEFEEGEEEVVKGEGK
jgi:hypothetical protein